MTPSRHIAARPASPRLVRRLVRRLVPAAAALLVLSTSAAAARAQAARADTVMYATSNTTTLSTVNRGTGALATVGTLAFGTSSLARDPGTGRLYYTSTNAATPLGRVAYYDPATNANTTVNAVGNGDNVVRLAFDAGGTLYGIGTSAVVGNSGVGSLYTIGLAAGLYTSLGQVRVGSATGPVLPGSGDIAFDVDGTLYAVAGDTSTAVNTALYRINTGTRIATRVGRTVAGKALAALAVGADGELYGGASDGTLYRVSKTTGAGTLVSTVATAAYWDFATLPHWADLLVTQTVGAVVSGQNAAYALTVTNNGPTAGSGPTTVTDSLPAGLAYVSATGTGWSCAASGQAVTCTTPSGLATGASLPAITLTAAVAAGAPASVTNVARVGGGAIDPAFANNRSALTSTVAAVDLAIAKTHAGSFTAGAAGVYTLTATNAGAAATFAAVTVLDTLPTGLGYTSAAGTGWTCGAAGQVVTCTTTGPIAAGAAAPAVTLTVAVGGAAAPAVTNVARVSGGGEPAARAANNSASDPATVVAAAVAVTPDGATADQLPSNGVQYAQPFTVTNTGAGDGTFTLAAWVTAGATAVTIVSTNGVAGASGGSVTLAAGASATVSVVYTVAAGAAAGEVASLMLSATHATLAAVTDDGGVTVRVVRARLAIAKVAYRDDRTSALAAADRVMPGQFVQYRISVASQGSSGAVTVRVSDPLPAELVFDSATPDAAGWTITGSGTTITAALAGTLPVGQSRFFWLRARVR